MASVGNDYDSGWELLIRIHLSQIHSIYYHSEMDQLHFDLKLFIEVCPRE